ncbi:hypothetical protein E4T56_gene9891 [Termitomyces sp. T112]|nr:hypothetical protein E4T56_gene9891 [Termitomyces sp. T112]
MGILTQSISSAKYPAAPRKPRSKSRFVGVFQHPRASTFSGSIRIPLSSTIRPRILISFANNFSLDSLRLSECIDHCTGIYIWPWTLALISLPCWGAFSSEVVIPVWGCTSLVLSFVQA